jgi:DNA-binding transcriptional ArsR family regulator
VAKLEALENPLRLAILDSLSFRSASGKELAQALGAPLGKVRYQLDLLRKAGLVEVKAKRQRRGVSERVYLARFEPLTEAEIAHLSGMQRERAMARVMKAILADALGAQRAGSFAARDDFMVARVPLALDAEGWADALAIHRRAQAEILEVGAASRARIDREKEPASAAFSCFLLFDDPSRSAPQSIVNRD